MSYRDQKQRLDAQRRWRARRRAERLAGRKPSKWKPGNPGRPPAWAVKQGLVKRKGARVEPQCKLPTGVMRAEHAYDEDGLCDCGAKRLVFAPRPELRAVLPKAPKKVARAMARLAGPQEPPLPPQPAPERVESTRSVVAASAASRKSVRAVAAATADGRKLPDLTSGGKSPDYAAVLADLQRRRDALEDQAADLTARIAVADRAIAALRELVQPA